VGTAIYIDRYFISGSGNRSGVVNVSGGKVSAITGIAIYNSYGTVTVSGSATITSANISYGTIYLSGGTTTLNINSGTVDNTATGTDGKAIYNYSTSTINISGGIVKSNGNAIHNYWYSSSTNGTGMVNISGGSVTSGSSLSAIYIGAGTVKITGGTITATNGYAVNTINSSVTITLGGDPTINGIIYTYDQKLSVLTSGSDIFNPGSKIYMLEFPAYGTNIAAVVDGMKDGKNFLKNFELSSNTSEWTLTDVGSGHNIGMAKAYKVTFNANGGSVTPASKVTDASGKLTLPTAATTTRTGYAFDGWFNTSANTGGTQVTESTVFSKADTIYARW
jgi:uncharacterized repeat protein (TIGR02543 family)